MAKCNILLVLDEPQRVYLPGEEIKGHVQVETDGDCPCKSLDVAFEVGTSGKGNQAARELGKIQVFEGKWIGQSQHRYPFSFYVPEDARPYHGTLLSVTYRVHARADVPWAIDPKDSAMVDVASQDVGALDIGWDQEKVKKGKNPGCFYVPLALFLFGVSWTIYGVLTDPIVIPDASIPLIVGLIGVLIFGRGWMATRRLGSVQLGFQMGLGGGFRVAEDEDSFFVVVKAKSAKAVVGITAELKVLERVVRGSGSNRSTYTHLLFESNVTLERIEEGLYRGRLTLPADGECPPSITFRDNCVAWEVFTRIDIPNWPDWTERVSLEVTPKKGNA